MDISIRSVGEASAVSGKEFTPGDRVWSCLFRSPEGLVERIDVLESERGELEVGERVLCKWSHTIKPHQETEAEARRAALESADDVFLSLFEDSGTEEGNAQLEETRDRLKFFLALQLERKRVLKPLGNRRFRHVSTGREVVVPELAVTSELINAFEQEISLMGSVR
jgi:hypothetical protein